MVERGEDDAGTKFVESSSRKKLEFLEDILPYIGDFGKYQWILLLSLFPFGIAFAAVFIVPLLIVAVPPKHWCKINELMDLNLTQDQRIKLAIPELNHYPFFDRCHRKNLNFRKIIAEAGIDFDSEQWKTNETVKCDEWEYDFSLIPYPSIGVEMNWICDQEHRIATTLAIYFVGSLFGNFIFGWMSDQKGRLFSLKFCITFAFIATIGIANSHHFWTFTLFRFILGFTFDNIVTIPVILILEYTVEKKRYYVTCLGFGLTIMIGKLLFTWAAYFIDNWRIFTYFCSVSFVICFFLTFIMPESICWYISKGLSDEVSKKLRRIAEVNGKSPEVWMYDELLTNLTRNKNVESVTLMDLRKTPHLAKYTALVSFIFALSSVIMDMNFYYLHRYELSIFLSFTWSCAETTLACVFLKFVINRLGRRFIGSSLLIVLMISNLSLVIVKSEIVKMFMASVSRFGMDSLAFWFLQYVSEFYPTSLRTQGSASIHFFATVMHFITPYIVLLNSSWKELPILIVAVIALLGAILALFLPETAGKNLRQTLREGENFCKEKKFWPILVFQKQ